MNYLEQLMARNEQIMLVERRHWAVLLSQILVDGLIALGIIIAGVILNGTVGGLSPLVLLLLVFPVGHFLFYYVQWRYEQYVITNMRVMEVKGVFNKHVSDSSLEKVNDVVMNQSAMGRMLGYGDIEIITGSDVGVNLFKRIADPIRFKTEMLNQKEALGAISDVTDRTRRVLEGPAPSHGDIPELIAELDELRRKGTISEQEFLDKKSELLARL